MSDAWLVHGGWSLVSLKEPAQCTYGSMCSVGGTHPPDHAKPPPDLPTRRMSTLHGHRCSSSQFSITLRATSLCEVSTTSPRGTRPAEPPAEPRGGVDPRKAYSGKGLQSADFKRPGVSTGGRAGNVPPWAWVGGRRGQWAWDGRGVGVRG